MKRLLAMLFGTRRKVQLHPCNCVRGYGWKGETWCKQECDGKHQNKRFGSGSR